MRRLAPVSLLALCLLAPAAPAAAAGGAAGTITVSGHAERAVTPDIARFTAGVVVDAGSVSEARTRLARRSTAVLEAVAGAGIPDADVATVELSLSPRYPECWNTPAPPECADGRAQTPIGFVARQTFSVTVRDLEAIGPVVDAVLAAGAGELGGISFDVDDPAAVLDELRVEAVASARREAQLLVEAAGGTLGDLVAIGQPLVGTPPVAMETSRVGLYAAAADVSVPVAAGTMTLSFDIAIEWSIGPAAG